MADRYLQSTSVTLPFTLTIDEVGTDPSPDVTTVTITRADGTVIVTNGGTVNGMNGGAQYVLTPVQTALLDTLTAQWTVTVNGQPQTIPTYAEIVGGYHFAISDLRRLSPLNDSNTYSLASLMEARTWAETVLEEECGRSFVPRYTYTRINQLADWHMPDTTSIRSVKHLPTGTVLTSDELTALFDESYGCFGFGGNYGYGYGSWNWRGGRGPWQIGVEHGMTYTPLDVARASMLLARSYLVSNASTSSSFDERATSITYEAGVTYGLVTPGVRGAMTSIPEVNRVIERYKVLAVA